MSPHLFPWNLITVRTAIEYRCCYCCNFGYIGFCCTCSLKILGVIQYTLANWKFTIQIAVPIITKNGLMLSILFFQLLNNSSLFYNSHIEQIHFLLKNLCDLTSGCFLSMTFFHDLKNGAEILGDWRLHLAVHTHRHPAWFCVYCSIIDCVLLDINQFCWRRLKINSFLRFDKLDEGFTVGLSLL